MRRIRFGRQIERTRNLIKKLEDIAGAQKRSLSEVALKLGSQLSGDVIVDIPGATKIEHVNENVGALGLKLTLEEMNGRDHETSKIK